MKKITESDLKLAVGSLQKYMQEAGYTTPAMLAARANQQAAGGYSDPAAVDKEIARFTAGNDMKLQANKDYVAKLEQKKAAVLAMSGKQNPTASPAGQTKPTVPTRVAPTPQAWVKELQTKLNAAGEQLAVDGVMGPATRKAQARHPEITTQPADAAAVAADINKGEVGPAPTPAPAPAPAPVAPTYSPNNPHVPRPDTTRQDAWEKLTPEDQKALGGADPTDPAILARMPNKGRPAAPVNESVTFANEDTLARIIQLSR